MHLETFPVANAGSSLREKCPSSKPGAVERVRGILKDLADGNDPAEDLEDRDDLVHPPDTEMICIVPIVTLRIHIRKVNLGTMAGKKTP